MTEQELKDTVSQARNNIKAAYEGTKDLRRNYGMGPIVAWAIAPTPDYFDGGSGEPSYELVPVDGNGVEGYEIFVADGSHSEWECWKVANELFGDLVPIVRSLQTSYTR